MSGNRWGTRTREILVSAHATACDTYRCDQPLITRATRGEGDRGMFTLVMRDGGDLIASVVTFRKEATAGR